MRLLQITDDGSLSFTYDLSDDKIPRYAILSHTWGPPEHEVLYQDVLDGSALAKDGFRKIRLCADQAKQEGLEHIWVDTCCINKHNSVELSEAINSMFKWYQKAEVCYVWLPDVSGKDRDQGEQQDGRLDTSIRKSRWFTRGWTLQELIAPKDVIFYSREWAKLGDKKSLERLISEITRIPAKALRGEPLEQFSITERLSWQDSRKTTKEEDKAYALLGICGVNLPLIYSEGQENAFRHLKTEIENVFKGAEGIKREDFAVPLAIDDVIGVESFVARQDELKKMREVLNSDGSRRTVVIHGLGGMGKTQLMIAYAKRHRNDYSAIFWLNAKDLDSLKASFANIARQILQVHPSAKHLTALDPVAPNVDTAVDAVKAWLSLPSNTRWLLLLDNLDNPKVPDNPDPEPIDIRKFLPSAQQGFVAVTTRSSRLDIGHQLHLRKLNSAEDSLKILSDSSHRDITLHDDSAPQLTKRLDGLPLALATAGAYLRQSSMDLSEYLRWHDSAWARLQRTSPGLVSYEDRMLYSTWQVSFDQVENINPLSAGLLRLWAYFDNQDLWYELLRHDEEEMEDRPQWIADVVKDKLTFEEAIRVLRDHGLVEHHPSSLELTESAGYSIHACVHSWTRTVLNPGGNAELAIVALSCIALHVPTRDDEKHWLVNRRLHSHASSFTIADLTDRCTILVMGSFGNMYGKQSRFDEAEELLLNALRGYEALYGEDHGMTIMYPVINLGLLYAEQGRVVKADEMYQRALPARDRLPTERQEDVDRLGRQISRLRHEQEEERDSPSTPAQESSDDGHEL
ncbi:hypothetical protein M409DRAFT_36539 [Zasmidium cellare ATCC 36951]|uniref:Heterokaryon incompatibility domain-containing protein n=1 Tax=Zasmidium cellare ATCC 36951 TaxID=1080233 RepID=A0A6A6CPN2_ZASCE|nr:uncharacterized protein M409DRAFT_36539 [Zasmidium cellare ATCC 36951]KAF2167426.1 hypothetical protein M409DRAFT_36539 [Zasmidium cellare ATCC 36951]